VPKTPPSAADDLFGPEWVVCPHCGCGIHLDDLKPCPCGNAVFAVIRLPDGGRGTNCQKVCRACCERARTYPAGAAVVGWLDTDTGRFSAA
jgi:hypothetical protein